MLTTTLDCEQIVNDAMVTLILDFPIYAQLIARIGVKVINRKDKSALAWTDGTAIYINKYRVERNNRYPIRLYENPLTHTTEQVNVRIGSKEMVFILTHELSHLLYETWERAKTVKVEYNDTTYEGRHKTRLWNIAADLEINSILHTNNPQIGNMPETVYYDPKYQNVVAEDIYKALVKEEQNNKPQQQQQPQQNNGNSNNSNGNGNNGNNSGNSNNGDDDNLDEENDNQDDDTPPQMDDEDNPPKYVDSEIDEHMPIKDDNTRNEVLAKIADVVGSYDSSRENDAMSRLLQRSFKPEPFNWRKALSKYIRGWMKDNYTWNKPSRAGIANNLILPSQGNTPKMHIAVAMDTSGSVGSKELETLVNHLFTILQAYKDFQVDVWCVSTDVHENTFKTFTGQNKKDLKNYQIDSNGGTDLRTCFEFIERKYKAKKPDVFIMMSDFCDALNGNDSIMVDYPCIWLVIDNKGFVPPRKIKANTYHITVVNGKI